VETDDTIRPETNTKPLSIDEQMNICRMRHYDLFALIVLTVLGLIMVVYYGAPIRIQPASLLLSGVFFTSTVPSILFLRWLRLGRQIHVLKEILNICRDWFPFSVLLFLYENLSLYTGYIQPGAYDAFLAEIEIIIWSVQPTIWIESYINQIMVDFMSLAYALHFPLPSALAIALYVYTKRSYFREFATAIIICNMVGFILYLVIPAGPPRFYLEQLYSVTQLPSYTGLYTWSELLWDDNNPVLAQSSFPSLHVAFSTVAMIFAYRRDHWPRVWWVLGPLVTSMALCLWISTIYLRHHWTMDIFSGLILGLLSVITARYLTKRTGGGPL
jgi:membrane-associated phospholipid phosphatase